MRCKRCLRKAGGSAGSVNHRRNTGTADSCIDPSGQPRLLLKPRLHVGQRIAFDMPLLGFRALPAPPPTTSLARLYASPRSCGRNDRAK